MVSKPKPCKYGCNTVITWNEGGRFFQGPDGNKHDCRGWPGVGGGNQGIGTGVQYNNVAPNQVQNAPPGFAPPQQSQETLIALQAKKTWENFFKDIPVIAQNTAAIVSELESINKLFNEQLKATKSLEEAITVIQIKTS